MGGRYCAINSPLGPRWWQKSLELRSRDFCPHIEPRGELIAQYRPPMSFRYRNHLYDVTDSLQSKPPLWHHRQHPLLTPFVRSQTVFNASLVYDVTDSLYLWRHRKSWMLGNTEAQYREQRQAEDYRDSAQHGLNFGCGYWQFESIVYHHLAILGMRMGLKFGHVIDRIYRCTQSSAP